MTNNSFLNVYIKNPHINEENVAKTVPRIRTSYKAGGFYVAGSRRALYNITKTKAKKTV